MRLSADSHSLLESFLRDYFQDQRLTLPPISVNAGWVGLVLTRTTGVLAITFGRQIFIDRKLLTRDTERKLVAPSALIAHEAVHVLQYHRAGFLPFLVSYLREYAAKLREQNKGWGRAARHTAYLAITMEHEAYSAEHAFRKWYLTRVVS